MSEFVKVAIGIMPKAMRGNLADLCGKPQMTFIFHDKIS